MYCLICKAMIKGEKMEYFALIIIVLIICITILCKRYMELCNENNIGIFDDEYNNKHILEIEKKELKEKIEMLEKLVNEKHR